MAMKMLFNLVVLMFMVSVIENERMVNVAEGKFCWIPSRTFHGICLRHKHCEDTCEQEGFVTGECKGIVDRRCMCGGECGGGGGSPPGGGGGRNPPPWGGDITPPEGGNTPPGPPEGGDTPPGPGGDFTPPEIQPPLEGGVADFPPDEGQLDNNQ